MEYLDRGAVAVTNAIGDVVVSWRLLADDPTDIAFHESRSTDAAEPQRLTESPIRTSTCFVDEDALAGTVARYHVTPVVDGVEQPTSESCTASPTSYLTVSLQTPEGYRPNDASVGDLDGDGQYEIVLHQAGRGRDNSQSGLTTEAILEAYKLDGYLLVANQSRPEHS
jgi:rhamnogalacturonan endolyase